MKRIEVSHREREYDRRHSQAYPHRASDAELGTNAELGTDGRFSYICLTGLVFSHRVWRFSEQGELLVCPWPPIIASRTDFFRPTDCCEDDLDVRCPILRCWPNHRLRFGGILFINISGNVPQFVKMRWQRVGKHDCAFI